MDEGAEDEEQDLQLWTRVVTTYCSEPVERGDLGEIYSAEIDCSEPIELDLRAARKRIAKCEELIALIKASELPVLVLEELNHLELVLVSWPPEIREMLIGAEPKKAAAENTAAENTEIKPC